MRVPSFLYDRAAQGRVVPSRTGPHVRPWGSPSGFLKLIIWALIPALGIGIYNTGWQALEALRSTRFETVPGWRGTVQAWAQANPGFPPSSLWDCLVTGTLYVGPALMTALAVGFLWQAVFAYWRGYRTSGLVLYALVLTMLLPPSTPLWQVGVASSVAMVFGSEIFGGWGKSIVHPALLGVAFVLLSFPDPSAGSVVWDRLGGFDGSPLFAQVSVEGMGALVRLNQPWFTTFVGLQPGPMGASSALAALLGGMVLILNGVVSWRVVAGGLLGMAVVGVLFSSAAPAESDPLYTLPWIWHVVLGSGLFGLVFVATDPGASAHTQTGRWLVGGLAGGMMVLIRLGNPAHPDGVVFALLVASIAAPLIDYGVEWANIKRRERRYGR